MHQPIENTLMLLVMAVRQALLLAATGLPTFRLEILDWQHQTQVHRCRVRKNKLLANRRTKRSQERHLVAITAAPAEAV